jgi:hypothetical protein
VSDQGAPPDALQAIWYRLGQHDGAIDAQQKRSDQMDATNKESFGVVHRRLDDVKAQIGALDAAREADKAEILGAIQGIKDTENVQKGRQGDWKWMLARAEFLVGAGLGAVSAYFGSRH